MAGRNRASSFSGGISSDGAPASKRRMLMAKSVDKWITVDHGVQQRTKHVNVAQVHHRQLSLRGQHDMLHLYLIQK